MPTGSAKQTTIMFNNNRESPSDNATNSITNGGEHLRDDDQQQISPVQKHHSETRKHHSGIRKRLSETRKPLSEIIKHNSET